MTAAGLAEELGVSVRTIYRDVADLEASGVPVDGEAGVGYRLRKGYELPPLTFDAEEIEALVTGARMVRSWADAELGDAARRALVKVEAVLPEPLRELLRDTALFAPGMGVPPADLAVLRRAISDRRKLRFHYVRRDGTGVTRTVRPVGLYFWGKSWSVAAWCEVRNDWRNFLPSGMHELEELDETFESDADTTLERFVRAMEARGDAPPLRGTRR
jgi:predicted DNA-binding transcriptional regulator YafY